MSNLLRLTRKSKQLGLHNSERVRKVTDRGQANYDLANSYHSQRHLKVKFKPEPVPDNYEDEIGKALDDAKEISVLDPTRKYLPRHKLPEILNPERVRTILSLPDFERCLDKDKLMEDILGRRQLLKLLAVLIGINKTRELLKYVEDGVDDRCLPMSLDASQKPFCQLHQTHHKTLHAYLRDEFRDHFSSWSYSLSAPYMSYAPNLHSHYVLNPWDVFPMKGKKMHKKSITMKNGNPMEPLPPDVNLDGGFSEVYRVVIEASHHNFGQLGIRHPDGIFALKKLNTNSEEEFNMELASLLFSMDKASGKPASKHLIQLLATFEVSDPNSEDKCPTYYLLFDWAEGNLPQFWERMEEVYVRNRSHCKWMSLQFHEICLALQSVHNERERTLKFINESDSLDLYGRHGDIKPDNFLWFRPEQSSDLLALSDFGLGRLHTQVSRSNQNPQSLARTATYIAPEFDLENGMISRASDIYSLGCVFLEYVTWFLLGYDSVIKDFPDQRMDKDIFAGWKSDKFFMIEVDENGAQTPIMKPQVRDWISKLQKHDDCSWYLHQLLEIIGDKMLEPERAKRIDIASLADEMNKLRRACEGDESFYLDAKLKR
ncbi:protein kinase [Annulohypoxylon maeteangense]|uniref:protein kinase n=1 Tax=Annulohypoxylon maeteangense TaxID=1927788 RepID=UPI002007484F|nr:protein kinase [Annulohypoxylon maeteangense]KAI0880777.1 protein kinase [Annulohypoxylon maeteangense]